MSFKKYLQFNSKKKILKSMNTDHRHYPRCHPHHGRHHRCHCVQLQMDGRVEKAEAVEVEGGKGDAADDELPLRICS